METKKFDKINSAQLRSKLIALEEANFYPFRDCIHTHNTFDLIKDGVWAISYKQCHRCGTVSVLTEELMRKMFIEDYNIVVVPREIKGKVVYFNHESLPEEVDHAGSQLMDKCISFDGSIPNDIIFNACLRYPTKMNWKGSNNEYGDVDWIDYNRQDRDAYVLGRTTERSSRVNYVLVHYIYGDLRPWYYMGYFNEDNMPSYTSEYSQAMKIINCEEAQMICDGLNKHANSVFNFSVEEHMYV